jgi:hypothetical protein
MKWLAAGRRHRRSLPGCNTLEAASMRRFSPMIAAAGVLTALALAGCAPPPDLSPGEVALIRAAGVPRNPHGGGWGSPPRP